MSSAIRKLWRANLRTKRPVPGVDVPAESELSGIIVYSAGCLWWDVIENAGGIRPPSGKSQLGPLPCCPFCGSVLYQFDSEEEFWAGAESYEETHPGYTALMMWLKGKCFRTMAEAAAAYEAEAGIHYEVDVPESPGGKGPLA